MCLLYYSSLLSLVVLVVVVVVVVVVLSLILKGHLRPIPLLKISLPGFIDSTFPGKSLWT